jgi:hypothetical protein
MARIDQLKLVDLFEHDLSKKKFLYLFNPYTTVSDKRFERVGDDRQEQEAKTAANKSI